jgi:hypothetical protein
VHNSLLSSFSQEQKIIICSHIMNKSDFASFKKSSATQSLFKSANHSYYMELLKLMTREMLDKRTGQL